LLLLSQVISAAAALSQTSSASSQETQDNLLSIAQAGIQSAQMSNKPVTSDQISQIVSVAAVGTGTNKKSGFSSGSSQGSGKPKRLLLSVDGNAAAAGAPAAWLGGVRQVLTSLQFSRSNRRLQEDTASPNGATDTSDSSTAASIKGAAILSVMDQAADLLLAQSTPASGLLSTGSQGLCVSVANLLGSTYAEAPLAVGEALEAAGSSSSNKAASTTTPDNVIVEFSSPLLGVCQTSDDEDGGAALDTSTGCADSTVAVVLQYYQDATLLLNTDVAAALEAGSSNANMTDDADNSTTATADPLPGLDLMSGAVVLAVSGANADDRLPCSNTTTTSSSVENATLPEGCGALLTLPIIGELSSNASKELIVLRIDASGVPVPDGTLLGVANGSTTSSTQQRRLLADGATTAQVWTSKSGTFMLGQVTRSGGAPVGAANDTSGSNATSPDNTTVSSNTTELNTTDTTACGIGTVDANVTHCNTSNVNTTVSSNTTELNTNDTTTNTTDPDAPSPGGNATISNTTQTNITAGNNTITNTTTPGTNVTTNVTTPATNNTLLGANTTTNTTTNATDPLTNTTASPEQPAAASPSPSSSPQQQLGSGAAGPSDTTVALNLTFPMKFSELSSSQSLLNNFKADVAANIAKTLGIDATLVEVVNIREGSVKCDVIVLVPASYNSSQVAELQTAVDQLVAAPDAALSDVKTKYNILQAITAAVWEEPDAVATADAGLAAMVAQLAKLSKMSTGKWQYLVELADRVQSSSLVLHLLLCIVSGVCLHDSATVAAQLLQAHT
jgi:hypothetical protein